MLTDIPILGVGKGLFRQTVIPPEPVDRFKKFKRRLEAETNLHKLYGTDL